MIEISKELLSEIMNEYIDAVKLDGNEIIYAFRVSSCGMTPHGYTHDEGNINIYELAHKCKEWAFKQGFEIVVMAYAIRIYKNGYEVYYTNTTLFDLDMFFKSCEWILNNKRFYGDRK